MPEGEQQVSNLAAPLRRGSAEAPRLHPGSRHSHVRRIIEREGMAATGCHGHLRVRADPALTSGYAARTRRASRDCGWPMGPSMERLVIVVDLALLRCPLAHRHWHLYPRRHHVAATVPGLAAHLGGIKRREEVTMAGLTDLAVDERAARMVLSLLVEPNDRVTGRLLARLGAVETLWLAEHDSAVVGSQRCGRARLAGPLRRPCGEGHRLPSRPG